ncbi:MAG: 2-amino-4-hydroxy-6-hydroxymethyldihydropteridine diphosphokinase [Myxococcota bacterium]
MRAFLGVGANLEDPVAQIGEAEARLQQVGAAVERRSRLYGSKPVGAADQPDYVNAVFEVETELGPMELLRACQGVEDRMGRVRKERWGARVIDLDILLYEERQIRSPELRIPHPEMHRRSFVLRPLAELVPERVLPGGRQTVRELSVACTEPKIWPLEEA